MDILSKLDNIVLESDYKPRRVKHGKKRSDASKKKGVDKVNYLKMLKKRKRVYKASKSAQNKAKKSNKKYMRSSAGKLNKRMYKGKK